MFEMEKRENIRNWLQNSNEITMTTFGRKNKIEMHISQPLRMNSCKFCWELFLIFILIDTLYNLYTYWNPISYSIIMKNKWSNEFKCKTFYMHDKGPKHGIIQFVFNLDFRRKIVEFSIIFFLLNCDVVYVI